MVFVYVQHRPVAEPTSEESARLRDLRSRGLEGESLERALVAEGTDPGRAKQLVASAERAPAAIAGSILLSLLVAGLGILLALGERPLREWLRREYPGSEWVAGALFPLLVLLFVLWRFQRRRRDAAEAPQGRTGSGDIDNRPIG